MAILHGGLRAWEFSLSEKIGYEVVQRLRMQMYQHLQGMTPRQVQNRSRGGLILRFIGDLSMLRTWISRGLLGGAVALIILLPAVTAMVVLNHRLGLVLIAVLAAGAAVSLASGHAMRRATRTMRRRRSLLISNLDEQINALPVVQVFGRSWGEYTRLSRQNDFPHPRPVPNRGAARTAARHQLGGGADRRRRGARGRAAGGTPRIGDGRAGGRRTDHESAARHAGPHARPGPRLLAPLPGLAAEGARVPAQLRPQARPARSRAAARPQRGHRVPGGHRRWSAEEGHADRAARPARRHHRNRAVRASRPCSR